MLEKLKPETGKKELSKEEKLAKEGIYRDESAKPETKNPNEADWQPFVYDENAADSETERTADRLLDMADIRSKKEVTKKGKRIYAGRQKSLSETIQPEDTAVSVLEKPVPEEIISAVPEAVQESKPKKEFTRIIPAAEKEAVEIKEKKAEKEGKISPEDEKIGEWELNLRNRYLDLYKDLKKGLQPSPEVYETIGEDINKLAEFYRPRVKEKVNRLFEKLKKPPQKGEAKEKLNVDSRQLKELYFELLKARKNKEEPLPEILDKIKLLEDKIYGRELRNEVGPIFDKIKMEAMAESGYKAKEKKEARVKAVAAGETKEVTPAQPEVKEKIIDQGKALAEKYGIKSLAELEKFLNGQK